MELRIYTKGEKSFAALGPLRSPLLPAPILFYFRAQIYGMAPSPLLSELGFRLIKDRKGKDLRGHPERGLNAHDFEGGKRSSTLSYS